MTPSKRMSLAQLNAMDQGEFESALCGVVENSPWVIRRAWSRQPFRSLSDLTRALAAVIEEAGAHQQMELLAGHPELAGQEAIAGTMTSESTSEQGRLGLDALGPVEHERLININSSYRQRFGFPLIIALRVHDKLESVFKDAELRLHNDQQTEMGLAIDQVALVIQGRLEALLDCSALG